MQTSRHSKKDKAYKEAVRLLLTTNCRFEIGKQVSLTPTQRVVRMNIPGDISFVNMASGVIIFGTGLSLNSQVVGYASRFAFALQVVILSIRVNMRVTSSKGSGTSLIRGSSAWWLTEDTTGVPNASKATQASYLPLMHDAANEKNSCGVLYFEPTSSEDLAWQNTGSFVPIFLYGYSDIANFGASSTDSFTQISFQPFFEVAFRTYQ